MKTIAVIVVVALVLIGIFAVQYYTYEMRLKESRTLAIKEQEADSTYYFKDKHGRLFAYSHTLEVSLADAKATVAKQSAALKSLAEELDKQSKMVASASVQLTGHDVAPSQVVGDTHRLKHDSVEVWPSYKSLYKDKWSTIDILASRDSTRVNYSFDVPMLVKMENRKAEGTWGFLKPPTEVVEFYSSNPHATLTNVRSIAIPQKDRRWGLGVNVTYSITPAGLQPGIGVGLQYNVLRW